MTYETFAGDAEAAWHNYYRLHRALHDKGMQIVAELAPTTGLEAHPGAEKLVDTLIDLAVDSWDDLDEMHGQRDRARSAEMKRDELAPAGPITPAPTLLDLVLAERGEEGVRSWLKDVTPDVLVGALDAEPENERIQWAKELLAAARVDGARATIIDILRSYITTPTEIREALAEPLLSSEPDTVGEIFKELADDEAGEAAFIAGTKPRAKLAKKTADKE